MFVDRIIVTIDGDLTSVEDIVGSIRIYLRDIQCLNNFDIFPGGLIFIHIYVEIT